MTPLNPILNPPKKAAGPTSNGLSISPHPTVFLKSFRTFLICGEKIHFQVLRKEKVVNACLEIGVYLIVLGFAICASWIRLPARILSLLFQDG